MRLLISYLALCWFRNHPLELEPSKSFMWKTVAFYLVSGMIVEGLIADPADGSLEVLLRTIMAFSSITVLLLLLGKRQHFYQLFTAIFVCENFIMSLAILTEAWYFWVIMTHDANSTFKENAEGISIGIGAMLVLWYLASVAYILRRSFDFDRAASLILAFGYFVVTYGLPMLFMDI